MLLPRALDLALFSAAVLGFRHGFDYDHIAAISDITSIEAAPKRAMKMGLVYVAGHAAMIALLGGAVIAFGKTLPARMDGWAGRAVGVTLIVLGVYVLGTLLFGAGKMPKSRGALLVGAWRWTLRRMRQQNGANVPDCPPEKYTSGIAFLIGAIHGLGAETPSQLLLFLLAVNLGGVARGFLGLGMFLAGLIAMNTLMTAFAAGIIGASAARPTVLRFVTGLTAAYSLLVGTIFLFGSSGTLPPLGG